MKTVADALAAWNPPAETYEADSYPFIYCRSLLVEAPHLVPVEITSRIDREVMSTPNSQGKERKKRHDGRYMARLYLKAWLEETGEDEWKAITMLADRYLELHGIDAPEDRHDLPPHQLL
ncbi:hypothetical protein [Kitasatospora sp. NPDC017646]|uniref:hypothetical protein n=1 Tax=Kitasatospora sp. NPDC017646 TaxID=3364024 RepID=UPI003790534C